MAIYAVGDVQGCVTALEALLAKLRFDARVDQLWLTGDLVNRGAHSLETLRLVKQLGDSAICVLGNHDLNLLAVDAGFRELRAGDTIAPILRAPDRDDLLEWLRHRPLMHCDARAELSVKTVMVHAGVYPGWRRKQARELAREVEEWLRGAHHRKLLECMYGRKPRTWGDAHGRSARARFILNAFTRMRYCSRSGELDFEHKAAPGAQPEGLVAWFMHPDMQCKKWRIVFGHWSAQGLFTHDNIIGLDSGCVWGRSLTAMRLDGEHAGQVWAVDCGDVNGAR